MDRLLPNPSAKLHTPTNVPVPIDDRGTAFGQFLRSARERRGLTIQQISNETKIPWRHLDALEHGKLHAVPGGVYRRGEIRAYAHVVGIDEKVALAQLERALEPPRAAERPRPIKQATAAELPARRATLFAIGIIAGVALGAAIILERRAAVAGNEPVAIAAPIETQPAPQSNAEQSDVSPASLVAPGEPERPAIAPQQPVAPTAAPVEQAPPIEQPPSVAPNPNGELVVSSDPPGARVTVNGIGYGVTPVTVRYLPFGEARIRLSHQGYATEEHVVRVDARRTASIHVLMTTGQ